MWSFQQFGRRGVLATFDERPLVPFGVPDNDAGDPPAPRG
jgi:hypothetical protein